MINRTKMTNNTLNFFNEMPLFSHIIYTINRVIAIPIYPEDDVHKISMIEVRAKSSLNDLYFPIKTI